MQEILSQLPEPMQLNETTLVMAVLFLVLVFVLNNLIFKPLVAILDERDKKITDGAEAAEQARKTVEESRQKYQKAKTEALQKAQKQRQSMLTEVENARSEMVSEAVSETRADLEARSAELKQQVADARSSLEKECGDIAKKIAETILSRAA